MMGSDTWRWIARPIAANKFLMRFPNSKMIKEWSYFSSLPMKYVNAQMKVQFYNASFEAKRELQQAWFRISGIPTDQRSIRTVAKVGDLVGKVLEIDEKTRFKHEYMRVRIACRDITRVPRSAESTLGIYLRDFYFEREVEVGEAGNPINSSIMIADKDQPPPTKKCKVDEVAGKDVQGKATDKSSGNMIQLGTDKGSGKRLADSVIKSAPPRTRGCEKQISLKISEADDKDGKVHIPETFDESDSDSETLSDKIGQLEGYGNLG